MESFVAILNEQLKSYQDLLELAEDKQQALISNEIKMLDELTQQEHNIINKVTSLENKRLEIVDHLTNILGVSAEKYTLKEIAKGAQEPFQEQLTGVYQELTQVVDDLHKINQENSSLIEQALRIVNFTMNTLVQSEREVVYQEKDAKNPKPISRIFDSKV